MVQRWDAAVKQALDLAFAERQRDFTHATDARSILVESVETIVLATMRACQSHPEWAQAALMTTKVPRCDIVNDIAALLVEGVPIERMAV